MTKNGTQRIITGLLGVSVMIAGIVISEWTYGIIFLVIHTFLLYEFYSLFRQDGSSPMIVAGMLLGTAIFVFSFLVESKILQANYYYLVPFLVLIFPFQLYRKKQKRPFDAIGYTFLGLIYITLPIALLNVTAFQANEYSWAPIIGIFVITWANDTAAYFVGSKVGRTKMFPRISPKKSLEGMVGGILFAVLISYIFWRYFTTFEIWLWTVFTIITILSSIYGDLVESMLKRSLRIKDSGNILPGHGGFLDRFDGILLSAPMIATFLKIVY